MEHKEMICEHCNKETTTSRIHDLYLCDACERDYWKDDATAAPSAEVWLGIRDLAAITGLSYSQIRERKWDTRVKTTSFSMYDKQLGKYMPVTQTLYKYKKDSE